MLNMGLQQNVDGMADDNYENFIFKTTQDIKKGEQLLAEYGTVPKPNLKLLLDYGFSIFNNPYDEFHVSCDIFINPNDSVRMGVAKEFGFLGKMWPLRAIDTEIPETLLLCSFLAIMPKPNLFAKRMKKKARILKRFDRKIRERLASAFHWMLRQFKTTLQEDLELAQKPLPPRFAHILSTRMGQKNVLMYYISQLIKFVPHKQEL